MAVDNKLRKQPEDLSNKIVEYECGGQVVKISPNIIKSYLVNGNGNVTNQEVVMFLNLCRYQRLNPFLREAYLIKYGSQPATIVTGKDAITKRAMKNPNFSGQQAGVVVINAEGNLENRIGTIVLNGESLVGGWAKVFVRNYEQPVEISVQFEEYVGKKSDGTINSQWTKKPATMIRKVALVQALREAFPDDLNGLYAAEEMDVNAIDLPTENIVEVEAVEVVENETELQAVNESNKDVQQALFGE